MVIGLCGRMGSGKSTALVVFKSLGLTVIDCDEVSRFVCGKGMPCLTALCDEFGVDILTSDGSLNRAVLAEKCFNSREKSEKLNAITHKYILEQVRTLISKSNAHCVVAAPLLFESGFEKECDVTLALTAPMNILLSRMNGRYTESDFKNRIAKQYSDEFLMENCDYVIENTGTGAELKEKIIVFLQCIGIYGDNEI